MKNETLYARVTETMADKVHAEAARLGESDAYVIRDALREYFSRREATAPMLMQETNSTARQVADSAMEELVGQIVKPGASASTHNPPSTLKAGGAHSAVSYSSKHRPGAPKPERARKGAKS